MSAGADTIAAVVAFLLIGVGAVFLTRHRHPPCMVCAASYSGLGSLAMLAPVESRVYGPVTAGLLIAPLALWLWIGIEQHRVAAGQRVWVLALTGRLIRAALASLPTPPFDPLVRPMPAGPFLTLARIRDECARQVLADAHTDPNLEEHLVRLEEQTLALLRRIEQITGDGTGPNDARRLARRRAALVMLANQCIDRATEPDQTRTPPPYARYSATTLQLAALCRLADDQRVLTS